MKTHAYPEPLSSSFFNVGHCAVVLSFGLLAISQAPAQGQIETCRSARDSLREELPSHFPKAHRLAVLNLNTSRPLTTGGPAGSNDASECWATVEVWTRPGDAPRTVRVIYTVSNMKDTVLAPGFIVSAVGIAYVCGESGEWDKIYAACR